MKSRNKYIPTRKGIDNHILLTLLVFDDVWKRFKKFYPLSMSLVQLLLSLQELEIFKVGVNHKLPWQKIILSCLQRLKVVKLSGAPLSFSLKYAIDFLFCMRTMPIPTLEALHSTSKDLSKFRSTSNRGFVSFALIN